MNDNLFTNNSVSSSRIIHTPSDFARTSLLYLQECGTLTAISPHVSSRANLSSYLFFVVTNGSGWLVYDEVKYNLSAGDVAFIDCKKSYSQSSSENLWSLKWCHFYGPSAFAVYQKFKERGGYNAFHPDKIDCYIKLLDELYGFAKDENYTVDMDINLKLTELLTLLMKESWHPETGTKVSKQRVELFEIKNYIDTNFDQSLTLESIAAHFYMNKNYLARRFKEKFGTTVNGYIRLVRITRAKELLRFSSKSILEVGEECGFEDQNYFSRVFKKTEGVSPLVFRNIWQGKDMNN